MSDFESRLQLPALGDAIRRAAHERRVDPERIIAALEAGLVSAAQQHFGTRFRFAAHFNRDDGELELFEVVKVVHSSPGSGEATQADCRAQGIDVEPGDELLFQVFYRDEDGRHASNHDRNLHVVTGLRTAGSGFALAAVVAIRRVLGLPVPDPAMLKAETNALTLAALPARERIIPGVLSQYQLRKSFKALELRRVYVVGAEGRAGITSEEAMELLGVPAPAPRERIELTAEVIPLHRLLLGLLDEDAPVVPLAAATAGLDSAHVADALVELGVDLARREIRGQPWTQLPVGQTWFSVTVVDAIREAATELPLAEARKLEPDARVGQALKFPQPGDALPALARLLPDGVYGAGSRIPYDVDGFEALRPLLRTVPTPPTLASFELGPLRQLFPEGHGVLYVDVAPDNAMIVWRQLDAKAHETGFRPILLGGSETDLPRVPLAWSAVEDSSGLQAGAHVATDPSTVLSQVDEVDVIALLGPGGNPSYPDLEVEHGEWPDSLEGGGLACLKDPLKGEPYPRIRLALIPTDAAWKAIAWMPQLLQAGEATPSMTQLAAVSRWWEEQFGARVAVIQPATVEWIVERPPTSREDALRIAGEHFTFSPEGGAPTLEHRASELMRPTWYAWWD